MATFPKPSANTRARCGAAYRRWVLAAGAGLAAAGTLGRSQSDLRTRGPLVPKSWRSSRKTATRCSPAGFAKIWGKRARVRRSLGSSERPAAARPAPAAIPNVGRLHPIAPSIGGRLRKVAIFCAIKPSRSLPYQASLAMPEVLQSMPFWGWATSGDYFCGADSVLTFSDPERTLYRAHRPRRLMIVKDWR